MAMFNSKLLNYQRVAILGASHSTLWSTFGAVLLPLGCWMVAIAISCEGSLGSFMGCPGWDILEIRWIQIVLFHGISFDLVGFHGFSRDEMMIWHEIYSWDFIWNLVGFHGVFFTGCQWDLAWLVMGFQVWSSGISNGSFHGMKWDLAWFVMAISFDQVGFHGFPVPRKMKWDCGMICHGPIPFALVLGFHGFSRDEMGFGMICHGISFDLVGFQGFITGWNGIWYDLSWDFISENLVGILWIFTGWQWDWWYDTVMGNFIWSSGISWIFTGWNGIESMIFRGITHGGSWMVMAWITWDVSHGMNCDEY